MNTFGMDAPSQAHRQMAQTLLNQYSFKLPQAPNILDALKSYDAMKKVGDSALSWTGDMKFNQQSPLSLSPTFPGQESQLPYDPTRRPYDPLAAQYGPVY